MQTPHIFIKKLITLVIALTPTSLLAAAPVITTTSQADAGPLTITGSGFGNFDGEIVSWDDFESHPVGSKVNGLKPIVGHTWSAIYDYNGQGIVIAKTPTEDDTGNTMKVDWTIDPETIRAFGWAGKGPYNQLYITYRRLMTGNFVASTANHKQFYLYGNNAQMPQLMPVIPGGQDRWGIYNNVSTGAISASNPNPNNINTLGWTWGNTNGKLQRWEIFTKLNTPYTEKNGVVQVWLDGKLGIDNRAYQIRHVNGEFTDFRLGHIAQGFYTTARAWFDDLYIATTPARVEMCDSKVYAECTVKHIQYVKPEDWTPTSIKVNLRKISAFKLSSGVAYLYVINSSGEVSNAYPSPEPLTPTPE